METEIVKPVPDEATDNRIHYIPHHGVWKRDAETTKLTLVYDASANERKRDRSLNKCLHKGPSLTPLLFDVLIRFRMLPIALVEMFKWNISEGGGSIVREVGTGQFVCR